MSEPTTNVAPTDDSAAPVAAADDAALAEFGFAIGRAFPWLEPIEPLRHLGEGWDCIAVETAGGIVFRFPRREAAGGMQAKEARLLPFLRSALTPAIPAPEWTAEATTEHPWGFAGYRRVPGVELGAAAIREDNAERLAGEIGQFLSELHRFPVARAEALDLPRARAWRPGYERLREVVLPPLRQRLRISEYGRVRRWWKGFLADDQTWDFEPTLVHRDLHSEHLLVDERARALVGVIDWGDAVIGDPAIDFVELVTCYGSEFAWRVMEAYRGLGMAADAALLTRVRRLGVVAPFNAVRFAAQSDGVGGPTMEEAVARVRAGAILNG